MGFPALEDDLFLLNKSRKDSRYRLGVGIKSILYGPGELQAPRKMKRIRVIPEFNPKFFTRSSLYLTALVITYIDHSIAPSRHNR